MTSSEYDSTFRFCVQTNRNNLNLQRPAEGRHWMSSNVMAPTVSSRRTHAARHGLPWSPPQVLDAFSSERVLPPDVRGTMQDDQTQTFSWEGGEGGGLTGVAQQAGAMQRCLGCMVGGRAVPSTPEQAVAKTWDPIVRWLLPMRSLSQMPMGKVRDSGHLRAAYSNS